MLLKYILYMIQSSQAGRSRSATIVIAYLMFKLGLSFKDARKKVKEIRPTIR